jgi:hypothetical protein
MSSWAGFPFLFVGIYALSLSGERTGISAVAMTSVGVAMFGTAARFWGASVSSIMEIFKAAQGFGVAAAGRRSEGK